MIGTSRIRWWLVHRAAELVIWLLRWTSRRAGTVVMYHRVEPRGGDPLTEFTPPVSTAHFDLHLRHLRRCHRVVPAAGLQEAVAQRRRGQPFPVAITFDDDTASHVRHAAPLLAGHGLPATFFLNGLGLDGPCGYWWERLQAAYDTGRPWSELLPADVLAEARRWAGGEPAAYHVSEAVERMPAAERRALSERLRDQAGGDPPDAGLRREQVRRLATAPLEVGFHGWHHEPLSLLDEDDLARELEGGRDALEEAAGRPLRRIAYPHGKAGEREARAARERDFVQGFTVVAEPVTPASDPLLLGRFDAQVPSVVSLAVGLARMLRAAGSAA